MEITITDVRKTYGDVTALDGPSFTIPAGATFGVLGTNGAGKTTLFRLLVGHDRADAGEITVGGLDVASAGDAVRERVGFLPEHVGFPDALTGREVLELTARLRRLGPDSGARIDEVLDVVGLTHAADRAVEGYSNGMGRRLGLAAALLDKPPVLLLDEPTAGLDPRGVARFHEIVERIDRETDATVVLSSHVLSEVERLCDEVVVLHEGQLVEVGSVADLTRESDGRVTVRIGPADDALVAKIQRRHGPVSRVPGGIELECTRSDALAVATQLNGDELTHFSVTEPGLEAAFLEAVAESEWPEEHASPDAVAVVDGGDRR